MIKSDPTKRMVSRRSPYRMGVVGMLLIFFLLILVGTFSLSVTRRAWDERRMEHERQSISMLESAIDAVKVLGQTEQTSFQLPMSSPESNALMRRWVEVKRMKSEEESVLYQGTLIHNDVTGLSIQRSFSRKQVGR